VTDRLEERMNDVEKRVAIVESASAVHTSESTSIKSDLKDIKDSLTWVTRLIIGSLILAIVAFIVAGGFAP
jgi:hypothetical protein